MKPLAVILKEVSRSFKNIPIFRGVNLKVNWGEMAAVVGPSGIGKTTLLRIVGTLDRPTEGEVKVCGTDVNTLNRGELAELRWSCLGFSFQEPMLLPGLIALDNVLLPCIPRVKSAKFSHFKKRAIMLLEALGLRDRISFKPHQLSVGQKKRVDLARALINNPKVLVADEPTTNLDEESARIIAEMLKECLEKDSTILLATHQDQNLLSIASVRLELPRTLPLINNDPNFH